jgi:hypothetical protein
MCTQGLLFTQAGITGIVKEYLHIPDICIKLDVDAVAKCAKATRMMEVAGQFAGPAGSTQFCSDTDVGWFHHSWILQPSRAPTKNENSSP